MKRITLFTASLIFSCGLSAQKNPGNFINTDIPNFWNAYDKIITTKDSAKQYSYLDELFIKKGSAGLAAFMQAREYTAKSYIDAINTYPLFWNSVRANTFKTDRYIKEIEKELPKLKALYPPLKEAEMYFTMGAMRSGGTTLNGMVLIGSEFAMSDEHVVTTEFTGRTAENRRRFFNSNPINDIVLLNIHEYVHTQQKPFVNNLLSKSLYEGVAEFVSVLATGKPSAVPAVQYGANNAAKIRTRFEAEMFSMFTEGKWLWSDAPNEFNMRDLGYYVGYAICEKYYSRAPDKKQAIKELIELDYTDDAAFEKIADGAGYFSAPLDILYKNFEEHRPIVSGIKEFMNGNEDVSPGINSITLQFSEKMDPRYISTGLGDLGKDHFPEVISRKFAEDGLSVSYEVKLVPGKHYQLLLENGYRSAGLIQLKPFLVDFKTAAQ